MIQVGGSRLYILGYLSAIRRYIEVLRRVDVNTTSELMNEYIFMGSIHLSNLL